MKAQDIPKPNQTVLPPVTSSFMTLLQRSEKTCGFARLSPTQLIMTLGIERPIGILVAMRF